MRGVLVSGDLLYSSRVLAVAQAAGCELSTALSPGALDERLAAGPVDVAILDLASTPGDLTELVARIRAAAPAARILAYGPHVDVARMSAAVAAGCERAFARGEFLRVLPEYL